MKDPTPMTTPDASKSDVSKLQLDLPILLPDIPDEHDACVERLIADLTVRDGMSKVHVVAASGDQPAKLCMHYDPTILSLARIMEIATSAGARLTEQFGHVLWEVDGLQNVSRARTVSDTLQQIPGVLEAVANVAGPVRIEFDRSTISETALRERLEDLGLSFLSSRPAVVHGKGEEHDHEHGGIFGSNTELIFALICGGCLAVGFGASFLVVIPAWIPLAFYVAAYSFGGYYLLREAIETLLLGRFEIDILMLVAAAGAAVLGEWAEGALLLFLFSIGHGLEHYAMGRARRAISALADLTPPTAEVRRDGATLEVPVAELVVGDTVVIRPNSRIPADGFVTLGTSSVDQAPVTGESVPVDKRAVSNRAEAASMASKLAAEFRVYAGTINGSGVLEIDVTKLSKDSTLARLVQMVGEAETQKSPTQHFTDRFERIFVPVVLISVGLLLFACLVIDEPFSASFYRAMAVLVAASPCALAISTPSAVLSGVARAARGGVLVKGGGPLENLGTLGAIAFDKTGTLTEGKPKITDVVPAKGVTEQELLAAAIAVEAISDHPLAAAVVRDGTERLGGRASVVAAENLQSITGRGLVADIAGDKVHVGKLALFAEIDGAPIPDDVAADAERLEAQGRTTMVVRKADRYLGVIGLMDTPRASAAGVIANLRALGITRMVMISGDNNRVADAVAKEVGLDEAVGDLMPEDKVATIKKLRSEQPVAMVGDGVNDAPAMANATVGIAMGAAGSDVALETADVALMGDALERLPFVIGLSRQTSRTIKQNLWISLGMVAILVPATLFGLQLGAAVLFHEGSTVLVVVNALRLLAYRDQNEPTS
jgi:Zn2+/Cd2+-exporting ATPase